MINGVLTPIAHANGIVSWCDRWYHLWPILPEPNTILPHILKECPNYCIFRVYFHALYEDPTL